jgi:hypothetical protein
MFAVIGVSLLAALAGCYAVDILRFEPQAPLDRALSAGLYGATDATSLLRNALTSVALNPFNDCSPSSCVVASVLAGPLLPLALLLLCIHALFGSCDVRVPSCLGDCAGGFC